MAVDDDFAAFTAIDGQDTVVERPVEIRVGGVRGDIERGANRHQDLVRQRDELALAGHASVLAARDRLLVDGFAHRMERIGRIELKHQDVTPFRRRHHHRPACRSRDRLVRHQGPAEAAAGKSCRARRNA